jgi:hypothetical protein
MKLGPYLFFRILCNFMDSNFISNGVVRRVSHLEGIEGRLEVCISPGSELCIQG